jgi:Homeodomain-like domain
VPTATPTRIRQVIVEQRETGASYASIGRALGMPYITVRKVYQHYQKTGRLEASYEKSVQQTVRSPEAIYQKAIELKAAHRGWGAGLIWVELADLFEESHLPSLRTLQRWFHRAGVVRRQPSKLQNITIQRGSRVHEVWALDAKEQIQLGDGNYVSWLTISDESSGAVLSVRLFPPEAVDTNRSAKGQAGFAGHDDLLGKTRAHTHG